MPVRQDSLLYCSARSQKHYHAVTEATKLIPQAAFGPAANLNTEVECTFTCKEWAAELPHTTSAPKSWLRRCCCVTHLLREVSECQGAWQPALGPAGDARHLVGVAVAADLWWQQATGCTA
jgi:hypothetical protein